MAKQGGVLAADELLYLDRQGVIYGLDQSVRRTTLNILMIKWRMWGTPRYRMLCTRRKLQF